MKLSKISWTTPPGKCKYHRKNVLCPHCHHVSLLSRHPLSPTVGTVSTVPVINVTSLLWSFLPWITDLWFCFVWKENLLPKAIGSAFSIASPVSVLVRHLLLCLMLRFCGSKCRTLSCHHLLGFLIDSQVSTTHHHRSTTVLYHCHPRLHSCLRLQHQFASFFPTRSNSSRKSRREQTLWKWLSALPCLDWSIWYLVSL